MNALYIVELPFLSIKLGHRIGLFSHHWRRMMLHRFLIGRTLPGCGGGCGRQDGHWRPRVRPRLPVAAAVTAVIAVHHFRPLSAHHLHFSLIWWRRRRRLRRTIIDLHRHSAAVTRGQSAIIVVLFPGLHLLHAHGTHHVHDQIATDRNLWARALRFKVCFGKDNFLPS